MSKSLIISGLKASNRCSARMYAKEPVCKSRRECKFAPSGAGHIYTCRFNTVRMISALFARCERNHRLPIEYITTWWRHQMETLSALLALCAENPPVIDEFPHKRPVTWSFDVFFDQGLNIQLSKQSRSRGFATPLHSLQHHCDEKQRLRHLKPLNKQSNFRLFHMLWTSCEVAEIYDPNFHHFTRRCPSMQVAYSRKSNMTLFRGKFVIDIRFVWFIWCCLRSDGPRKHWPLTHDYEKNWPTMGISAQLCTSWRQSIKCLFNFHDHTHGSAGRRVA